MGHGAARPGLAQPAGAGGAAAGGLRALVGHRQAGQFTAYIADVGVLYQLVTSVRRDTCDWCGLAVIGDRCPFCSAVLDGQRYVRPPDGRGRRSAPVPAPPPPGRRPPRRYPPASTRNLRIRPPSMNSRQRRGVVLLVVSALCALAAFAGVVTVIGDARSQVGPKVTAYRLAADVPAYEAVGRAQLRKVTHPRALAAGHRRHRPARSSPARSPPPPLHRGSLLQTDMIAEPARAQAGQRRSRS